jgi:hypothetical protein
MVMTKKAPYRGAPRVGQEVAFQGEGGTSYGTVVGYEDGYAMVRWYDPTVRHMAVTGVSPRWLTVVPVGYSGPSGWHSAREPGRPWQRAPQREGRWTVEAGRQLYFDGRPCLSVGREGDTEPVTADGATHLIADLLNQSGATPDSIFQQHMGFPRRR